MEATQTLALEAPVDSSFAALPDRAALERMGSDPAGTRAHFDALGRFSEPRRDTGARSAWSNIV